jgi:hypothetical protein
MRRVLALADLDKDGAIDMTEAEKFAKQYGAIGRVSGPNRPGADSGEPRRD